MSTTVTVRLLKYKANLTAVVVLNVTFPQIVVFADMKISGSSSSSSSSSSD